jgi:hypothetical protein
MRTTTAIIFGRATSFVDRHIRQSRDKLAKWGMLAVAGMLGLVLSVPEANALVCARGVYRAGCISSHGAIGVGRGGVVAVGPHGGFYGYRRGSSCYWFNSQLICR